jgi:hypothetical protein
MGESAPLGLAPLAKAKPAARTDVPGPFERVARGESIPKGLSSLIERDGLNPCEAKLLAVLGQRHPRPTSQHTLSMLSRYRKSGSFYGAVTALRKAGYLQGTSAALFITEDGLKVRPPMKLPRPGPELVSHWAQELSANEPAAVGRIFLQVVSHYPGSVSKEQVVDELGYRKSGSTEGAFTTLKAMELLEKTHEGWRAARDLMVDSP